MSDEMGLVERLRAVDVLAFATSGDQLDQLCAEAAAAIERLVAENRALLNDNPLVSYDGARFVGADNEVLVAATPDLIRCPRPANGRPDCESVETCNASDNCGCCYRDRARQALGDT